MDTYTIEVDGQTFVVDVEALDADRFGISVDGRSYNVTLGGHAAHTSAVAPAADIAPAATIAAPTAKVAAPAASAPAPAPAPRKSARGGGAHSLNAPMPGVILEVSVSAGDTVERGQQVAILEAMKMNNVIRSPRAGIIAEVCVEAGQALGHGDAIVRFKEG